MEQLFREQSQRIRLYMARETVLDPYEKNVVFTQMPSLPVSAIVTDLTFTKIQYAMPGVVTDKAKEIIIKKKYQSLLEKTFRIGIGNEFYKGWIRNEKLQFRIEDQFLRAYIYIEKVT